MEPIRTTHLRQLQGCLGDIAYELRIRYQATGREQSWTPAINAYLCHRHIVVCVELAGVAREQIDLQIESGRLVLRGARQSVDAMGDVGPLLQVMALEIDQGLFYREIPLPRAVNPSAVTAEQRNGLLWIYLPLIP